MDTIGLHIIGGTQVNLGRPRLVKLVNVDAAYVRQVRAAVGPQALIIVRWVEAWDLSNPEQAARDWYARHHAQMAAMADANVAFESCNEIPDDLAPLYARFEAERLSLMHEAGLRSVVGNFSVGTPDLDVWATYRPMLQAMRPGDLLGLHEYWIDTADINNRWHCGRWTIPEIAAVIGNTKIVITECGRDLVEGRGKPGWRQACGAAEFLEDLRRYNALLEQFPNVVGGTVFSTPGPGGAWASFDPSEVWPAVVAGYSNPQTYPRGGMPTSKEESMGPDPTVPYYHSSRHGRTPAWIIVHDTEGPASAALNWWRSPNNASKSSAHYLVTSDSKVVAVVPERLSAHHAGGGKWPGIPEGATGGTSNINHVSIGIELEYPAAPASPPWPTVQLAAAAKLVREIAQRYGIPRERVLRHADVDPARKSDPRNLDWEGFLDLVFGVAKAGKADLEQIRKAAWAASGVAYNPDAALARYARAKGLGNPVTAEVDAAGVRLQGFSGGIVWCRIGDWTNCQQMSW